MADTELLRVVVRPDEAELVKQRAAAAGYDSVSAYVRWMLNLRGPGIGSPAVAEVLASREAPSVDSSVPCSRASRHKPGVRCGYCGVTP